ncbi:hypothetical protein BFRIPB_00011 (plasmid) [Peribacillus frigoritolerans]|uniref:hypothetical protein n=1 Tax=Peribacillus frigoritolerans TaxID=450367 RepID=UPI0030D0ECB1
MKLIKEELDHFLDFLKEVEEVTGQMPMVILESRALPYSRYSILGGTRNSIYLTKSDYFLSGKENQFMEGKNKRNRYVPVVCAVL